ncbi:hypothetical protein Mal4_06260 [Maioricimonas rarisocia]|uniref:ZIP Zinc transporter n=1 Tax=Maioricimonas rarisocia TaxID=2528026 RepID=A0A517Z1I3_9PLAN|nr:hypothetical protein [Maioricimonas rarisocia]QDU36341.1 hypothetical protein Mal4_06260 [Maioricimonas rarisocia]
MWLESLLGACVLSLIHLFASRLRFLDVLPRSRWLSIAGGVAVAYALIHLLPEVQHHHHALAESTIGSLFGGQRLVWAIALLGLMVFYWLESLARRHRQAPPDSGETGGGLFWLHMSSYSLYNMLLGYLLVREDRDLWSLVLYVIGIGLHFVVNDHGLQQHHRKRYRRYGRWILSAAILAGWGIGVATEIHRAFEAAIVAFLAGGILLNSFKEELPEERESRFSAFALGAFLYAAIMLAV